MKIPIMLECAGLNVLVVGMGKIGRRRAKKLSEAGAGITVCDPNPNLLYNPETSFADCLVQKGYQKEMIECYDFVIAATNQEELNYRIIRDCKKAGIACSSIHEDDEALMSFPAVLRRGDLQISVYTDAKSPALSKQIREQIETVLPEDIDQRLELLGEIRKAAKEQKIEALSDFLREITLLPINQLEVINERFQTNETDNYDWYQRFKAGSDTDEGLC